MMVKTVLLLVITLQLATMWSRYLLVRLEDINDAMLSRSLDFKLRSPDNDVRSPDNHKRVFLGGSCNPTTWRRDIAIPILKRNKITYFNPQVDEWYPELEEIEANAKKKADILLFVIDDQTRAIASMVEAAQYIASGREVILVITPHTKITITYKDKSDVLKNVLSEDNNPFNEYKDLKRGRIYLEEFAKRHMKLSSKVTLFHSIEEAVNSITRGEWEHAHMCLHINDPVNVSQDL